MDKETTIWSEEERTATLSPFSLSTPFTAALVNNVLVDKDRLEEAIRLEGEGTSTDRAQVHALVFTRYLSTYSRNREQFVQGSSR